MVTGIQSWRALKLPLSRAHGCERPARLDARFDVHVLARVCTPASTSQVNKSINLLTHATELAYWRWWYQAPTVLIQKNAHPKTTCRVMERTRRSCTSNSCHMRECRVIACHMYLDLSDKFHQGRQFGCKSISATLPFTNRDRRSRMYKSFALLARPENNLIGMLV